MPKIPALGGPQVDLGDVEPFSCSGRILKDDVVDGNHTTVIVDCGCLYFDKVIQLRSLSRLVSPTGQDMIAELPYYRCVVCGMVYTVQQVHAAGMDKIPVIKGASGLN
jgi:hypothetical protein